MTIESNDGRPRAAPPALVVAVAVGLGTVDMPVPSIAEWEWLNWKFPRPVHAGDTLYARWTLTQKRPPVGGAPSSIVVWRVDVHTGDGALCAEGEVGAKVKRMPGPVRVPAATQAPPPTQASAPSRRRRRRPRANGAAVVPETPAVAAPPAAAAKPERISGSSRRRRRRRPGGSSAAREEDHEPRAAHVQERPSEGPPATPTVTAATATSAAERGTISRVLKRLRRS